MMTKQNTFGAITNAKLFIYDLIYIDGLTMLSQMAHPKTAFFKYIPISKYSQQKKMYSEHQITVI